MQDFNSFCNIWHGGVLLYCKYEDQENFICLEQYFFDWQEQVFKVSLALYLHMTMMMISLYLETKKLVSEVMHQCRTLISTNLEDAFLDKLETLRTLGIPSWSNKLHPLGQRMHWPCLQVCARQQSLPQSLQHQRPREGRDVPVDPGRQSEVQQTSPSSKGSAWA